MIKRFLRKYITEPVLNTADMLLNAIDDAVDKVKEMMKRLGNWLKS